ncbi:unnamed protein product [Thelazia callipaeda]|uniref:Ovule protein n=1 Tax=Thelazia callipaeda TaxID=103827 RepID=A0A0N5CQX3_THECL|nr:unnamed protein product [Thelazia callipaeda]
MNEKIFSGSSPGYSEDLVHNYLQVPKVQSPASGRSSPSVVSMQSDPESCIEDVRFSDDLIETEVVGKTKNKPGINQLLKCAILLQ